MTGKTRQEKLEAALGEARKGWDRLGTAGDSVIATFQTLKGESDRGCVLIVASMFDELLEACLRRRFTEESGETSKDQDLLLSDGGNPPLQSFATKTRLAYVLGIIDEPTKRSLDAIRKLRNECAHGWNAVELSANLLAPVLQTLTVSEREFLDKSLTEPRKPDEFNFSDQKTRFLAASLSIANRFVPLAFKP